MSTSYHLQIDVQSEKTIQTLEIMLRACILDWEGNWGKYRSLAEFSYNNIYHSNIEIASYKVLYGRPYHTPLYWA